METVNIVCLVAVGILFVLLMLVIFGVIPIQHPAPNPGLDTYEKSILQTLNVVLVECSFMGAKTNLLVRPGHTGTYVMAANTVDDKRWVAQFMGTENSISIDCEHGDIRYDMLLDGKKYLNETIVRSNVLGKEFRCVGGVEPTFIPLKKMVDGED